MKDINILSIIEAYRNINWDLFQKFMNGYGINVGKKNGIRDYELDVVEELIKNLFKVNNDISIFDKFYLGYSIPQIGNEFDLLRFGENYIINIELKTESIICNIFKQQVKNNYYLSFLEKPILIYTYIKKENKLYKLICENGKYEAREVFFSDLCKNLLDQKALNFNNIDDLFNPSDYLVSPFNSTQKFIDGKYFLTNQQCEILKKIENCISDTTTNFIALTGNAGTGKTLLTYHIANKFIKQGFKVLILNCAQLNKGHKILRKKWEWEIYVPNYAPDINNYDLIIVDEAQRLYPRQFNNLINNVRSLNKKCIFSYDEKQYLKNYELRYDNRKRIEIELSCIPNKLTDKIRTNKEISNFIKQLFDCNKNIPDIKYPNIKLMYSKNFISAKAILQMLSNDGWKVSNYTPGLLSKFHYEKYNLEDSDSAHSVIGQEFDRVVVVIDDCFKYNESGELIANNQYYSQKQMLYQIITRTRKNLCIVIINNEIMLERCLKILN